MLSMLTIISVACDADIRRNIVRRSFTIADAQEIYAAYGSEKYEQPSGGTAAQ